MWDGAASDPDSYARVSGIFVYGQRCELVGILVGRMLARLRRSLDLSLRSSRLRVRAAGRSKADSPGMRGFTAVPILIPRSFGNGDAYLSVYRWERSARVHLGCPRQYGHHIHPLVYRRKQGWHGGGDALTSSGMVPRCRQKEGSHGHARRELDCR